MGGGSPYGGGGRDAPYLGRALRGEDGLVVSLLFRHGEESAEDARAPVVGGRVRDPDPATFDFRMPTTRHHPVHIHIHEGPDAEALAEIEGKLDLLMAKIDEVQETVTALDSAVRSFLSAHTTTIGNLMAEIETLKADDEVENSKLDGISATAEQLRQDVVNFGGEQPETPEEPEPAPE